MPIPGADFAKIDDAKIRDYLLNETHPVGGSKARWFISLGFDPQRPRQLADAFLTLLNQSTTFDIEETEFGIKYIVRGDIDSPNGSSATVLSVWIIELGATSPRLVTAYPDLSN